jgi:hypothetical protein
MNRGHKADIERSGRTKKGKYRTTAAWVGTQLNLRGTLTIEVTVLVTIPSHFSSGSLALPRLSTHCNASYAALTPTLVDEGSHSDGGEKQILQNWRKLWDVVEARYTRSSKVVGFGWKEQYDAAPVLPRTRVVNIALRFRKRLHSMYYDHQGITFGRPSHQGWHRLCYLHAFTLQAHFLASQSSLSFYGHASAIHAECCRRTCRP